MKKTYQYRIEDGSYDDDPIEIESYDIVSACEDFAEHCYSHRDGWEWMAGESVNFFVREKGSEIETRIIVTTEFDPTFYCRSAE